MTTPAEFGVPLVGRPYQGEFRVSSKFGAKEKIREGRRHTGIDFAMPEGTPLFACMDGEILCKTADDANGAGNRIHLFNYKRGIKASYFHMRDFADDVKAKPVKKGDFLGWSGNTGHSSGAHLHFEIRRLSDAEPLHPYFDDEESLESVKNRRPYELAKAV